MQQWSKSNTHECFLENRYKTVGLFSTDFCAMSNIKEGPHKRLRVYDESHAEIILRVRQYFEYERNQKKSQNLMKVVERTAAVREALWWVSLRPIKPVTDEFGCQIVYID